MSTASDAFSQIIEQAVRRALNVHDATQRRLLSIADAATYLSLSKSEIYNMLASHELESVEHGKRRLIDIRDLEAWIERNKG